jgi:mutator protein MutT
MRRLKRPISGYVSRGLGMKDQDKKPHFHVAAGLIWKDGKVLITKRPRGSHLEGLWEFPGGKQEKGESLQACLEREIREELGLRIRAGEILLTVDHEYGSRAISLHTLTCTYIEGEAAGLEGQELRWIAPTELSKLTFPPPDRAVIEFLGHIGNRVKEEEDHG